MTIIILMVCTTATASSSKFEWKVTYPSCPGGYWISGCGQRETKLQGTVKCYGTKSDSHWEAKDAECTSTKPAAPDRVCPATKPCPRCKGCKRDGGCWKTCGDKAGKCSKCDARSGRMGACCRPGAKDDPIECKLAEFQFANRKTHTCALLPADKHVGYLFRNILGRLQNLEKDVEGMKPWSANSFKKAIADPEMVRKLSLTDDDARALVKKYDEYLARLQDPRNAPTLLGEPTHVMRVVYEHRKTAYAISNFYGKSSAPSPRLTVAAEGGFWIERVQGGGGADRFNILHICESDFETPARVEKGKKFYVYNYDTKLNPDEGFFVRAAIDMSRSDVTEAKLFLRIVGQEPYVKAVESGFQLSFAYMGKLVEQGPWNVDSVKAYLSKLPKS